MPVLPRVDIVRRLSNRASAATSSGSLAPTAASGLGSRGINLDVPWARPQERPIPIVAEGGQRSER
jgi:hypothetical protein